MEVKFYYFKNFLKMYLIVERCMCKMMDVFCFALIKIFWLCQDMKKEIEDNLRIHHEYRTEEKVRSRAWAYNNCM